MHPNRPLDRRHFLAAAATGSLALFAGGARAAAQTADPEAAQAAPQPAIAPVEAELKLTPPANGIIHAAFPISARANVIDTAGPWEVFLNVMFHEGGVHRMPFRTYTVAATKDPIRMGGGLQVIPTHTFDDAPQPQVIVVPAQLGNESLTAWLQRASEKADVTMSVCTGAFQLARAGLLVGLPATTHHAFYDQFAKAYPGVELRRGLRYVDNGRIATAGGLTSGIDLAIHIVGRYYGVEQARKTAAYLEHQSETWLTNQPSSVG
jgi:transcriptional regulator GlxA family with amidase domain